MPFHANNSLRYYTFDCLDKHGIPHAVFTRQGGVSPEPWRSLNVGGTVGDDRGRVEENRRRSFAAIHCAYESLYDVWQVHGNEIVCSDRPRPPEQEHIRADGLLTDRKGVTLFMRFADCVPILVFDPQHRVIGLAHAGWQGTVLRTAASLVKKMQAVYDTKPAELVAAIGPSIGPDHYEIGQDVIDQVERSFSKDAEKLLQPNQGDSGVCKVKFDLWQANRLVLEKAGVKKIETAEICTACHVEDWYSHRAEAGRTGRFGILIAL